MMFNKRKLTIGGIVMIAMLGILSAWLLSNDIVTSNPTDEHSTGLWVLAQSPYPGEELPLDGSIEVYFNLPVEQSSVEKNLRVSPSLAFDLEWLDEASLRIVPRPDKLRRDTTYKVSISTQAHSTDAQYLAEAAVLAFKTPGYLEVSEVVPAPDTGSIDADTTITVFFNRPVTPLVIAEEMGDLPDPITIKPSAPGKGEWINTSIYQWKPEKPLVGGETYKVTIPSGLSDQSGATLQKDYHWEFTVKPPMIVSVQPEPDAEQVVATSPVTVTFEQPMDQESTQAAFSLTVPSGHQSVGGLFGWNEDSTVMTFTPGTPLARETRYVVSISKSAMTSNRKASLEQSQKVFFNTMPLPKVIDQEYSKWSNEAVLYFNILMDEATLTADRVTISPDPPDNVRLNYSESIWHDDARSALFISGDFQDKTEYTITLLPGAADPDGLTIDEPYRYSFTAPEREITPVLQMNSNSWELPPFGLYDASRAVQVTVLNRGYPGLDFELYRLPPDALTTGWPKRSNGELIRQWSIPVDKTLETISVERVSLGRLAPGTYILVLDAPGFGDYDGRDNDISEVMFVTSANITLKTGPRQTLAWLTGMQSGQPLEGKTVNFYNWRNTDYPPTLIGQVVTDQSGLAMIDTDLNTQLPWYSWSDYGDGIAIVNDGATYAVTTTRWSAGVSPSSFDISISNPQTSSVYIYTDRPIYRPGQEVFFKAILRDKDDMTYTLPASGKTLVTIRNGDTTVYSDRLEVSAVGTVDGFFTLKEDADLGTYTLSAEYAEQPDDYFYWYYEGSLGYREGLTSFTVSEYRKPEIEVSVALAQPEVLNGETVNATVDTAYYFGGPAVDVDVTWRVFEYPRSFKYEGPGRYSFYSGSIGYDYYGFYYGFDDEFYPETVYAEGSGRTDKDGRLAISFPANLGNDINSSRFMIEATIEEVAGLPVSNRANVIAHPARYYVGIQTERYFGAAGQEMPVELIVVDWSSRPVEGQPVSVQMMEREWVRESYQDDLGQTRTRWTVQETPVGDPITGVSGEDGIVRLSIVPPYSGCYSVWATVTDPAGNQSSSQRRLWIWGEDPIPWPDFDEANQMEMTADQDSYAPGDQAAILVNSPFEEPTAALVTIERGSILKHEVITLPAGTSTYTLPIVASYAPNIYVSIVTVAPAEPIADFRVGLVDLAVSPIEQTLQVTATPLQEFAEPGTEIRYQIEVKDYAGNPVEADLSLMLVDKAVLALADLKNASVLDAFYRHQPEGVYTSVSLVGLVERQFVELVEDMGGRGGGGGKGGPAHVPLSPDDIRSEFKDTAYWRASIRTNADGLAEVTIPLPDNLTTWRLDARAVTLDTRVGQTTVDVIATKPLLIRPVTPRFFIAHDEATLGAIVNNNTQNEVQAVVMAEGTGFTFRGEAVQGITIPANSTVQVSWPVTIAADARWVDLTFSVQSGGLGDASKPTVGDPANGQQLPVYTYEVPETVGTAGQLFAPGSRIEGILLPRTMEASEGEIRVQIDPSLAATTIQGLDWLQHYPHECVEQTLSRMLPNAVTLHALRKLDMRKPVLEAALEEQIQIGLGRINGWQNSDGSWGWFYDRSGNPMTTAYAVHTLVEVSEAGIAINDYSLKKATGYIHSKLGSADGLERTSYLNRQAYFLFVLAKADAYAEKEVDELFKSRKRLSNWSRALLAQTIWMHDPDDPRLDTLQSDLINEAIVSATGAHWEDTYDYHTWTTNTRTTAMVLDTFVLLWPDNDLIPNVTRWLMVARDGDHWETTQETAWAIIALTDTMQASGELTADYDWTLALNGDTIGTGKADAQTLTDPQVLTINFADLLTSGVNKLAFQHSEGPGRLYYTTHMTAYLPVEQVKSLNRGISINRRYLNADGEPVTSGRPGDTLRVEVTLVTERSLNYVAIEDYYPAGAEAVDAKLLTESESSARPSLVRTDKPLGWGWGWWYLDKAELRDERAVFYAEHLPAGTYQFVYQIRLVVPGLFRVIPPVAWEFYFPEVYGRGDGMLFEVEPAGK
ncbi:MAG: Ig-like domain-containing protein [Anaerolineae bacterium]|nr:Ig-like domain-containing protein [Anaerolineae bacterium]